MRQPAGWKVGTVTPMKALSWAVTHYFPCGSAGKESACDAGDLGSIPGLRRSPGKGKGYPLQYSGLENSVDCIVCGVAKSRTRLSDSLFTDITNTEPGSLAPWLSFGVAVREEQCLWNHSSQFHLFLKQDMPFWNFTALCSTRRKTEAFWRL